MLSRRSFVKAGGALLVGASGLRLAGSAAATPSPFASAGPPDPGQADSYLAIHAGNTAWVLSGL
jgi:hypothetical protein